jgi:hypothetical protein
LLRWVGWRPMRTPSGCTSIPKGGLAFIVVPLYQGIILGLLAVLLWLVEKRQTL